MVLSVGKKRLRVRVLNLAISGIWSCGKDKIRTKIHFVSPNVHYEYYSLYAPTADLCEKAEEDGV